MTFLARQVESACGCDASALASGLISIDTAWARIADAVDEVRQAEEVSLQSALGRVLAQPVRATSDMPRFDHSAMDGYAIHSSGLTGEGPWTLPVVARVAAGTAAPEPLSPGAAVRIFTGAPMPEGSDCVVMQEHVAREGRTITLTAGVQPAGNVRFRGEEHASGDVLLAAGTVLTPRAIAASASAGHGRLDVRRRLRVTVIASGSELALPGASEMGTAQIWDVNTPMLGAVLTRPDVDLLEIVSVADDPASIRDAIGRVAAVSDLVVTTGGVSVGEEDHLLSSVRALGGDIHFSGVAIKPGKPVAFGHVGSAIWLGLPGNPQSAFVTWTLFGEAILRRLSGVSPVPATRRHVVLGHSCGKRPGRCEVRAATLIGVDGSGRDVVDCRSGVRSGQVAALARSDGLVFLPADTDDLPERALVEFLPFCSN